ncbi:5-amino-6-(5-phosphoribosylamino)uracil reductase [Pontibacillus halophilus JSM 076056 = DSM 19796]|uniref:Riboflavin biosynthesis protein RibD n=1 Tax=Pontibacillus halophilus JSM 076056 = DSM 19796 TaxID=1385510 RepID=A0A0A5ID94_9BACI|nr:bifunctional diaminohydroxyphosphoribosylaminopyrimidine deaminase/5-amino-6-(5-phosphoribosylamino)uracil reductase RibD [Pontibacillus halophilus]KGX93812.1 5-amino-6-(5-phosphoribosylamino)uracil reductase [Pontibacillus halophilus JSM 076056 = DSM 19796]
MDDQHYMKLAIEMARATKGQTSPNPSVGAVVVKDNEVLGMGAHLKAGEAHAEVHALTMAGDKAKGATIYVTLEPCSHYGKTPPCAELVIQSGIKRAVVANQDPNPQVSGRGIRLLEEAGIEVAVGVCEAEAATLNPFFYHSMRTGTPYVTLKTAMSMDGKIATATGESQWITSEEARLDVHRYRHKHDAILVGVNTVLSDNPSLTTRLPGGGKHPIRVVLDTHLRTPLSSSLIQNPEAPTWIITGSQVESALMRPFADYPHVQIVPLTTHTIEIKELLTVLGERDVTSLFVEGGGTIHDAFVRAKAVQEVVQYIAPILIGGKEALTPVEGTGIGHLSEALRLTITEFKQIGPDLKVIMKPEEWRE